MQDVVHAGGEENFLRTYLATAARQIEGPATLPGDLVRVKDLIMDASRRGKKTIVVGNGGSAAMASHVVVDLTKNARVRAVDFNEPDLITCLANDFGFENWLAKAIEFYGDEGDVLIAVSSSGRSKNILKACESARDRKFGAIVTLSGMAPDNPLRASGDVNLWVDSRAYNHIEMAHHVWLVAVVDLIIGRAEYPA